MFDVVIQGPVYPDTERVISSYSTPFTNNLIYSGWEDDKEVKLPNGDNVFYIKNKKPSFPGTGNLNYHLQSTKAGLEYTNAPYVLKTRSDLILGKEALELLEGLMEPKNKFAPYGKILVMYINKFYPFFTNDFLYFGHREDIKLMYSAPHVTVNNVTPESYINATFMSHFEPEVKILCQNPQWSFHVWKHAPGAVYTTNISSPYLVKYFKQLPSIQIEWTKKWKGFRESYTLVGNERLVV